MRSFSLRQKLLVALFVALSSTASADLIQIGDQYVATDIASAFVDYSTGIPVPVFDPTLRDFDFSNGRTIESIDTASLVGFNGGDQIRITRIGIGGDADSSSGPGGFAIRTESGAQDLTFAAGQNVINAIPQFDRYLGVTPRIGGNGRGFVYGDVDILLGINEGFDLDFVYQFDRDGRYTNDRDLFGNRFDDSAFSSSIRGWVQFEIVSNSVPSPAGLGVLLIGLAGLVRRRVRHQ